MSGTLCYHFFPLCCTTGKKSSGYIDSLTNPCTVELNLSFGSNGMGSGVSAWGHT